MRSGDCRSARGRSRWWLVATACLVASLLPMTGAGATVAPASSDESSSGAAGTPADPEPEDLVGDVEVVRYAGSDHYELSIELAQALVDAGDGSSEWVVLASGESWADAAAAGPLAATLDAPVVLVPPGGLQSSAARPDLVEFLQSAGVRRVVIVGNPDTLPNHEPSVLFGLGMVPRNIERVHGADPIEAAIAVAERIGAPAEFGESGRTVIIASDQSVADAVAVGPLAAAGPFPLLFTAPDALDPRIAKYLADHETAHVVLVGGTTALAHTVQDAIETAGLTVTRLSGQDRYHTAALAMDLLGEVPRCADDAIGSIGFVLAEESRLALTAGRLLGPQCIPLLFTDTDRLSPVTQNHLYLHRHRTDIDPSWHLIGDSVAVDPSAIERPPVRMATVADNPDGDGQHIVVLDEHHQARRYLLEDGFDGITRVRWAPDHETITFTAVRNGNPFTYTAWLDGPRAGEGIEGDIEGNYELDLRSGTVQPQPRVRSRYAHLIEDAWVDPMPSPGHEYIVFRAPTEDYAGHSLFALDIDTETITQLTHNTTDDTHHVVSSDWLFGGRRLVLTHLDISQLEEPAPTDVPTDTHVFARPDTRKFGSQCENVPLHRAHIIDVTDGRTRPLFHGNHLIDDPILSSPDGRFVAIKSYEDYEFAPEHLNGYTLWLSRCSHDGVGAPSVSVYDVSGHEPRAVNGTGTSGFDPMWSPDSRYLIFRAPTDTSAGHSLFALDVESGNVTQLTRNQSGGHHHVAQQWLPTGNRLLYTVQSMQELAVSCGGLSPSQRRASGVPHIAAHVVHLDSRRTAQLEFDGFIVSDGYRSGLDLSPDGTHVAFPSGTGYEYSGLHGSCRYYSEDPLTLNVFDVTASEPRAVPTDAVHSTNWRWSPDGRYLAYDERRITGGIDRTVETDNLILDTKSESVWRIDATSLLDAAVELFDIGWSDDSERLLYLAHDWSQPGLVRTPVIATVAAQELLPLELRTSNSSTLRCNVFSPDGLQIAICDWGATDPLNPPDGNAGLLYVNDAASDGALLEVYDLYDVTAPATPVLTNPPLSRHTTQEFRYQLEWTVAGIFAAGEHYLYTSPYR